MRAPVVRLTIGDYFYRTPGFLESVNVTIDGTTSWEINLENSADVAQLPHYVDVNISFKPIFDVLPKRNTELNKAALITKSDGSFLGGIDTSILENNLQSQTRDLLKKGPPNLADNALSDKLLRKVDVSSIKTPIKKISKPPTPFKMLTDEQLNNNLLGKNKYNAG